MKLINGAVNLAKRYWAVLMEDRKSLVTTLTATIIGVVVGGVLSVMISNNIYEKQIEDGEKYFKEQALVDILLSGYGESKQLYFDIVESSNKLLLKRNYSYIYLLENEIRNAAVLEKLTSVENVSYEDFNNSVIDCKSEMLKLKLLINQFALIDNGPVTIELCNTLLIGLEDFEEDIFTVPELKLTEINKHIANNDMGSISYTLDDSDFIEYQKLITNTIEGILEDQTDSLKEMLDW